MSNTELEIWKDIENYPDYQVSNYGNVKSLNYNKTGKERILKQEICNSYCQVMLCKEGKIKTFRVHRLVATAFIPNSENKPQIDHIDTNRQNNNVNNLRWVTNKENCNNPITRKNNSKARKDKKKSQEHKNKIGIAHSKPILQFSKSGNIILGKYISARQVERELNINHSNICECCNGKRKSCGGYKWMYYDDYFNQMNNYFDLALKEVS